MNFAIVGCGRIFRKHIEAISALPNSQCIGIFDINREKALTAAQEFKLKSYDSYEDMLRDEHVDFVVVLTDSGSHYDVARRALLSDRNVIIEKPVTLLLPQAQELADLARSKKLHAYVVKQNRFNEPIVAMKNALDQGRFGQLNLGTVRVRWCRPQSYYDQANWRGTWRNDGGVIANQASHHIDLLQWMMGPVKSVVAFKATRLAKVETEDTLVASLVFQNGALGQIEATTAARPRDLEGSISILGSTGSVEINGFAVNKVAHWEFEQPKSIDRSIEDKSYSVNSVYGPGHKRYYESIIQSYINGEQHPLTIAEGMKSLEIISAIYTSSESHKMVDIPGEYKFSRLGK